MEHLIGRRSKSNSLRRQVTDPEEEDSSSSPKKCKLDSLTMTSSSSSSIEILPDLYKQAQQSQSKSGLTHHRSLIATETDTEVDSQSLSLTLTLADIPSDTEAALLLVRNLFPVENFLPGTLPPIILTSQLKHIIRNNFRQLDTQLEKLARNNRVLLFSATTTTSSSNERQIVFYDDFLAMVTSMATGATSTALSPVSARFVTQVLPDADGCTWSGSLRFFTRSTLMSRWKFEENEIRQLVNGGYLGIREGGTYCLSLPGAGRFVKAYQMGKKTILNTIKRSKFGEILQSELEKRSLKKSAPLGAPYHLYDLLGSGTIESVETTSGPLLRLKRVT